MSAHVRGSSIIIDVDLATVATAYSTGNVVGTPIKFANAVIDTKGTGVIQSLTVIDPAVQKKGFDLYLFKDLPTSMGADHAAFALSDAEFKSMFLGKITHADADYSQSTACAEVTIKNIGLEIQAKAKLKDLWGVVVTRGAPDYSTAGLTLKLGILQD